jgi:hypothetical protein
VLLDGVATVQQHVSSHSAQKFASTMNLQGMSWSPNFPSPQYTIIVKLVTVDIDSYKTLGLLILIRVSFYIVLSPLRNEAIRQALNNHETPQYSIA